MAGLLKKAEPLLWAERQAKRAGDSPLSGLGSALSGAGTTKKGIPVLASNSRRLGEAEASTQGLQEEKITNLQAFR